MKIKEIKKKNGTTVYRSSIYLGRDSVTNKQIKTTITARTKTELKNKIQHEIANFKQVGTRSKSLAPIKTYKELANLWLESYVLTVKPQSYKVTLNYLNSYILPTFEKMRVDKINAVLIQSFINDLSKKIVHFKTVHSINTRILQLGVLLQVIPFNPARDIILPKRQIPPKDKVKFINKSDLKKFLAYMDKLANKRYTYYFDSVLYKFLLSTGCRFGEASALEWSDIDFDKATVSISKTYSRSIKQISTPKSEAGNRIISIDKKTVNMLRVFQNRQRQTFLSIGGEVPSVVFATVLREYQNLAIKNEALGYRCNEVGIPRFTFHAFRHTHASLLLNAGISYKELQYRLGHANISMTIDTYSHLSKEKEKEAVIYYEKAMNEL